MKKLRRSSLCLLVLCRVITTITATTTPAIVVVVVTGCSYSRPTAVLRMFVRRQIIAAKPFRH